MELLARHFECHPTGTAAHALVSPLVNQLGEVPFTGRVGAKNSGQCDSDLDDRLAERFCGMTGVARAELPMPAIEKKFDFAFHCERRAVVVEVEKANWEKVLYDFLKAHLYFASGADFVVVFVPKNYVHSGKSSMKSFEKARQRYDQCVAYSFGSRENLGKILLVGYEQAVRDGRLFTPALRKQFIEDARKAKAQSGEIAAYDPATRFRQCDHTLTNIFLGLERTFTKPEGAQRAKVLLTEYLVLDAVIGNTDRHHENWGIMRKQVGDRWQGLVAPSFDHASSLGRELLDVGEGKSRKQILTQQRIGQYSEKASGAIYWSTEDKRGLSPLELVRRATRLHPDLFKPGLARVEKLDRHLLEGVIARVPEGWMPELAREFALELLCYNVQELRKLTV